MPHASVSAHSRTYQEQYVTGFGARQHEQSNSMMLLQTGEIGFENDSYHCPCLF